MTKSKYATKYTVIRFWFEGGTECETFYTTKYLKSEKNLAKAFRKWEKMQGKRITCIEYICTAKNYNEAVEIMSAL